MSLTSIPSRGDGSERIALPWKHQISTRKLLVRGLMSPVIELRPQRLLFALICQVLGTTREGKKWKGERDKRGEEGGEGKGKKREGGGGKGNRKEGKGVERRYKRGEEGGKGKGKEGKAGGTERKEKSPLSVGFFGVLD